MRHMLGNILSNALKYSPAGGDVAFSAHAEGDAVVLAVRDRGIGIPAADLPHLFGGFYRAGNVGAIPGTGLGLAIVKQAVDLHGGTIAVESRDGKGTCFRIVLPALSSDD
jgi:signal transduction histidine kinase